MTEKLVNKPNSSRKHKAMRAHSRRNLQALTSSTCKRTHAISSEPGSARSASWRPLTRLARGPAGASRSISGRRREAAREQHGTPGRIAARSPCDSQSCT